MKVLAKTLLFVPLVICNGFRVASARGRGAVGLLFVVALPIFGAATARAGFVSLYSLNYSTDGGSPLAGLIQGSNGDYYGTTEQGGYDDFGTVFQITASGSFTLLYTFSAHDGNGVRPVAGLVQGSDGNFYGTTSEAGPGGSGTIFKITPDGSLTTLHNFTGSDGGNPSAALCRGSDGELYGTTTYGGSAAGGTVFKITSGGTFTTLYSFNGGSGAQPYGTLVEASDGNFYGTTSGGGASSAGTVFRITPAGSFATLYSFAGDTDGAKPYGGLVQGKDGNFYGTTWGIDGSDNHGTVFKITSAGSLTTVYNFNGNDGSQPYAGLVEGRDHNFYGTTVLGGASNAGTVFKITSGGSLTTLHSFNGNDGGQPFGGLVQGSDRNFYGTTSAGTVFKITLGDSLATTEQCKDNGWMNFVSPRTFKNQGDCIQFVITGK